jgi:hypothetical protein
MQPITDAMRAEVKARIAKLAAERAAARAKPKPVSTTKAKAPDDAAYVELVGIVKTLAPQFKSRSAALREAARRRPDLARLCFQTSTTKPTAADFRRAMDEMSREHFSKVETARQAKLRPKGKPATKE